MRSIASMRSIAVATLSWKCSPDTRYAASAACTRRSAVPASSSGHVQVGVAQVGIVQASAVVPL
jgi:hypothetical protein